MTNETKGGEPADERAAFVQWLSSTYPTAYDEWDAQHWWIHNHVSALAWQARAALQSKACASVGVEPSDTLRRKKLLCRLINEGLESGSISDDDAIFLATPPAAPAVTEPVPYLNERLQDFTCRRAENAGGCEGMTLYFTKLGAHSEYQLYSSEALALWINLGKALGPLAAPAAAVPESPADPLRVACVTLDGSTLTVPVAQLGDVLHGEDDQHTYTLTLKTMTRTEFDALGEFNGF